MNAKIVFVQEHLEVYDELGNFLFSADNQAEAMAELKKYSDAA